MSKSGKHSTGKIKKSEFKELEIELWEQLLSLQYEVLQRRQTQIIIDFAGVDGAGKGQTINLLNRWMDPRWIVTRGYAATTDIDAGRPPFWRFWRDLPPRGQIGLYLSGRYSRHLLDYVYGNSGTRDLMAAIRRIRSFESALAHDGAVILKFWMHLDATAQKRRLKRLEKDPLTRWRVSKTAWQHLGMYERFMEAAEQLMMMTGEVYAPWHFIDGSDTYGRGLEVGTLVRDALRAHLEHGTERPRPAPGPKDGLSEPGETRIVPLDSVDLSPRLGRRKYRREFAELQAELNRLEQRMRDQKISTVLVFEGPDAAGKGGALRRLLSSLDARYYKIIPFAAPTDEEKAQHYLWRFWRRLPRAGWLTVFDRSWYGRVLVERVEGFAGEDDWQRAYGEINEFEEELCEHGIALAKFWIHVSKDEQLKRFERRKALRHKRWKLTDDDWRNREKWDEYTEAADEMLSRTHSRWAPWHVIEGDDKLYARIKVMRTVRDLMARTLDTSRPG